MTNPTQALIEAARELSDFTWSAVMVECASSRAYLQSLVDRLRAALLHQDEAQRREGEDLKPCPFCGAAPKVISLVEEPGNFEREVMVRCDECAVAVYGEYRSEAVTTWNRRAASPSWPSKEEIARTLFDKFGVQCGMPELAMWRPIARAALALFPAPTQEKTP